MVFWRTFIRCLIAGRLHVQSAAGRFKEPLYPLYHLLAVNLVDALWGFYKAFHPDQGKVSDPF